MSQQRPPSRKGPPKRPSPGPTGGAVTRRLPPPKSPPRPLPAPSLSRIRPYPGGLLGPRQVVTLTIQPPLTAQEQPVLIASKAGDVLIQEAGLDYVIVANQTDRITAFGVTVLPRLVVRAATLPWGQIARDLGEAVKASGVVDQVKQLLGRSR